MRILAIETSSRVGSVALLDPVEGTACCHSHDVPNAHAERLWPLVERCLAEVGWSKHAVERIAVGVGPGSFTGLRVGIAAGMGMAAGLGTELVAVGSLQAMAVAARHDGPVLCALDAKRDEFFAACFDRSHRPLTEPRALPRIRSDSATRFDVPEGLLLVGEAARDLQLAYPELAHVARSSRSDSALPSARFVAEYAATASPRPTLAPVPIYVRPADAILPKLPPSPLVGHVR